MISVYVCDTKLRPLGYTIESVTHAFHTDLVLKLKKICSFLLIDATSRLIHVYQNMNISTVDIIIYNYTIIMLIYAHRRHRSVLTYMYL